MSIHKKERLINRLTLPAISRFGLKTTAAVEAILWGYSYAELSLMSGRDIELFCREVNRAHIDANFKRGCSNATHQ